MKDKLITFYKSIEIPKIFSLLLVFFCYETMKAIRADTGWTVCVIVYILCYVSAQRFGPNFRKINMNLNKIWQILLFYILYLYFVFSLLGTVFLESSGLDAFSYEHYLFLPMAIIWPFPLFLQILVWIDAALSRSLPGETQFPLKWKLLAFAALAANYSLWVAAFNPCINTYDSAYLFNQAHVMGIVPMLNWHPPFYAIVLHFLLKICDSATFLICVQCTAFSILIIRLLTLLLKKGISKRTAVFLYLALGFAFNNVIQMITLWKDIPYMMSLLWLTVVLADLILTSGKISRLWYIEFFLALVFTALFRQNGIVPAIAAAIFITVYFIRRKKFVSLIPIAVFIITLIIIEGPVYSFYKVQSVPGLKYIAMSNDIIGTYYDECDSSDDVMKMLNAITNNDPDHWEFNSYYISTYNSEALKDYSVPEFLSVYIRTFFEHPSEMANEFAKRNSEIWSVTKPHNEIVGYINELGEWHKDPEFEYSYPFRVQNILTDVFSAMANKLTYNYLVYVIAWRTAVYLLGILFLLCFVSRKKKMLYFIPFIPVLFNLLSLMVGSGWTDYRYYWPTAILALFLAGYTRIILAPEKEAAKQIHPTADS